MFIEYRMKLDGVGPVDNRPSDKYLHNFVQKKYIYVYVYIYIYIYIY